ncbi:hypothetical protein PYW07_000681 [Mythimna separata]|uniref:Dynein intermediate chain 3, ciliary n=1 Tax=Mythimna separata TaxID=271217 RepID=A0AAD7YTH4_MYTSE|nr:hypothetical protein PYW07_000681 [Mythimna separata]
MALTHPYAKQRNSFGRQPMFCVARVGICDSIASDPLEQSRYCLRNPVHTITQNAPNYSHCEINTIRAEFTNSGANHAEGGWPESVNVNDPEATQRYRRKIEKDDGYIHCVMSQCPGLERLVLQNNAIEMYQTYYTELMKMPDVEYNSCRTVNVYRVPGAARPVSSLCWAPEASGHFAATHVDVDYYRQSRSPHAAYIWDVENANTPARTLFPPCPVLDLKYNPKDGNVLAGGLLSGSVAAWDTRSNAAEPSLASPPHTAHRDLVRNVLFINSKTGQEFFSGGPDGVVKWWDLRRFDAPTDEMIIDVVKYSFDVPSMAKSNGVSALEYEPTIPSRFMVGTENGFVITGNRKGKTALDKLPAKYTAHLGTVWRVERNPGFLKNFLTVGDWTARVWSEDCKESAILWTPYGRQRICDGAWSPMRLSLLLLVQYDGRLCLWDLLRRQHEPVLTVQVCDEPLLSVRAHETGTLVACGSSKGHVYMQELSPNLAASDKNDKILLTMMLEREAKRERILETRMREIKLKQRQAEEGSPVRVSSEVDTTVGDRDLLDAAQEYMQLAKKELAAL